MAVLQDEATALDDQGDEATVDVSVPAGATLKATLVWTDPPGDTLQNDLDLIVRVGGDERHGNMLPNSTSFDRVNNVEQVLWTGLAAAIAKVIVRAHRIQFPQSFALVVRMA